MDMHTHGGAHRAATQDPITLEVIRHGLLAIPNHIDKNIVRTAFSPLIYEYKDFAVGILDPKARLVAQGKSSLPIFVANALGVAVTDGLAIYGIDGIDEGDIVICNHSGTLGQHLNNVVMYTPIITRDREHLGFMAVLGHWMDLGGKAVGSCATTDTFDIFQEGIQFRTVKLFAKGKPVPEIFRIVEHNTRFPKMVLGDINSLSSGCYLGRDMVLELADRYGPATLNAAIESSWTQTEASTRAAIQAIPDGRYEASSFIDDDGVNVGKPLSVHVALTVADDKLTVDFTGMGEQAGGPVNAGRNGGAVAAARIACKFLFTPGETGNDGAFRPLEVVIPEGKFISARAEAPMALSGSTLPTVIDTIFLALAEALPDKVAAAHHGAYGNVFITGHHPDTGALFQTIDSSAGGWGASLHQDGTGPCRSIVHGDIQDVPIEMQEALYPYRFETYMLRPDSAGAGRMRGGLGTVKSYQFASPCTLTVNFDRTRCLPWGLHGGRSALGGYVDLVRPDGTSETLYKGTRAVNAGDMIHVYAGGGGGFGPPHARDPARVAHDVREGYVSRAAALSEYGVVLNDALEPDLARTEALRHGAQCESRPEVDTATLVAGSA